MARDRGVADRAGREATRAVCRGLDRVAAVRRGTRRTSDRDRSGARRRSQYRAVPGIPAGAGLSGRAPRRARGRRSIGRCDRCDRSHVLPRGIRHITLIAKSAVAAALGREIACLLDRGADRSARDRLALLHRCRREAKARGAVERHARRADAAPRSPVADAAPGAAELRRTPHSALRTHSLVFPSGSAPIQARSGPDVTATGQFMLVRRDVYEAAGGHAAVCTAICEDLEFARRLKHSGRSVLLMGGDELFSARMYTGWRTLWPGLAKNLVDTLGGPAATLTLALGGRDLGVGGVRLPADRSCRLVARRPMAPPAALIAGACRLGRGDRPAYRGHVPFPHSFLVRSPLPARLYGGCADGCSIACAAGSAGG